MTDTAYQKPLDSGNRQSFDTGAVRDVRARKGRFDLLPYEPILQWALWTEAGAEKYEDRNWEKGIPLMRFLDSAFRHLVKLIAGHTDENHAAAVLWNVGGYIQTLKWVEDGILPANLDDRPKREAKREFKCEGKRYFVTDPADVGAFEKALDDPLISIPKAIQILLAAGPVSGLTLVSRLRDFGLGYTDILLARGLANVEIVTIDGHPYWKLKETK